jgi:hypothetical protein
LNIKLQKIHWDFGASFLVFAATFDHLLGILESNLEGGEQKKSIVQPGYQKSEIIIKLLHIKVPSDSDGQILSLFFSQNGKFPSHLDETSLKTEDFHPK